MITLDDLIKEVDHTYVHFDNSEKTELENKVTFACCFLSAQMGFSIVPADSYRYNGLRYTYETTKKIGINAIFLPLEVMQLFAHCDVVTCVNKKQMFWMQTGLLSQIKDLFPEPGYQAIKIGCLAYCALNSSYDTERRATLMILNDVFDSIAPPSRRLLVDVAANALGV